MDKSLAVIHVTYPLGAPSIPPGCPDQVTVLIQSCTERRNLFFSDMSTLQVCVCWWVRVSLGMRVKVRERVNARVKIGVRTNDEGEREGVVKERVRVW